MLAKTAIIDFFHQEFDTVLLESQKNHIVFYPQVLSVEINNKNKIVLSIDVPTPIIKKSMYDLIAQINYETLSSDFGFYYSLVEENLFVCINIDINYIPSYEFIHEKITFLLENQNKFFSYILQYKKDKDKDKDVSNNLSVINKFSMIRG